MSRTLVERPRPAVALLVTIAACLLVRLAVAAGADWLGCFPGGADDGLMQSIERKWIRGKGSPKIVIAGSSRVRDGVIPSELARELGLAPNRVANISLSAGTAWEALALLRRHPGFLEKTRLVVIDVHPGYFNESFMRKRFPSRFYRHATLAERLDVTDWRTRLRSVADWVWPFVSQRRQLLEWAKGPTRSLPRCRPIYRRPARPGFRKPVSAKRHSEHFEPSERMVRAYERLLGEMGRRGIQVLIVYPPAHTAYSSWMREISPGVTETFEGMVKRLERPGVSVAFWERPEETLMSNRDFGDYGHFTRAGATRLTRAIALLIHSRGLLAAGTTRPAPTARAGPAGGARHREPSSRLSEESSAASGSQH